MKNIHAKTVTLIEVMYSASSCKRVNYKPAFF